MTPIHSCRMAPYRTLRPEAGRLLPRTEQVAARVIVLPSGTAINESTIMAIAELLRKSRRA